MSISSSSFFSFVSCYLVSLSFFTTWHIKYFYKVTLDFTTDYLILEPETKGYLLSENGILGAAVDRIVLETDGPFMAPTPFRGKVAEPSMVPHIAKVIADVKNIAIEDVFEMCRENTRELYNI